METQGNQTGENRPPCIPTSTRIEPDTAYETTKMPEPPFQVVTKEYATLEESIRDLKDMDKNFVTTPEIFLDEFVAFLQQFQKNLQWYADRQYWQVFAAFSPEQFQFLRDAMNAVKMDADQFLESVKRMMQQEE